MARSAVEMHILEALSGETGRCAQIFSSYPESVESLKEAGLIKGCGKTLFLTNPGQEYINDEASRAARPMRDIHLLHSAYSVTAEELQQLFCFVNLWRAGDVRPLKLAIAPDSPLLKGLVKQVQPPQEVCTPNGGWVGGEAVSLDECSGKEDGVGWYEIEPAGWVVIFKLIVDTEHSPPPQPPSGSGSEQSESSSLAEPRRDGGFVMIH